jgi:hypothetical protein
VICANKEKTMSKLTQWLDHRMEVVGLNRWKDLSEYSGICSQTIRDMNTCGSLLVLSRSDRRSLAAALRISLRKLEQLDAGQLDWIEDKYIYDVGVVGRPTPSQENDPAYWVPKEAKAEDRGTPLIGNIRASGKAEPDEDWQEEWGRHIPQRWFGRVYLQATTARVVTADGSQHDLDLVSVVRIGKVVGRWPNSDRSSSDA